MAKNDIKATTEKRVVNVDSDKFVPCMNLNHGPLTYVNRSGMEWRWEEFGDEQDLTVGDLKTMLASYPRFIKEPWILILDEEVIMHLRLDKMYESIVKPSEVPSFLKLSEKKISERLVKAPSGVKELIVLEARKHYKDGSLTVGKQKLIEQLTGASVQVEDEE